VAILGFLLAGLVGLSLGLLGGGGSILTVPILVYLLGFAPKTAIAMSLPIVGATSLAGAVGHWRAGNVRPRTAVLFGLAAMAGAFAGARLSGLLTGAAQLAILAVVMLAAAASMLRGGIGGGRGGGRGADAAPEPALAALLATAVGVGVLTGVVGIGGGFLVVPALVLLARVPMKEAVGTSLLVIAMNSAAGAAGYAGRVAVPWDFMVAFTGVAMLGIAAGTTLVRHVPQDRLKRAFAVFLLGVGLFTLYQNRAVF
jgi:uncharacterized membrane protein YfcA